MLSVSQWIKYDLTSQVQLQFCRLLLVNPRNNIYILNPCVRLELGDPLYSGPLDFVYSVYLITTPLPLAFAILLVTPL